MDQRDKDAPSHILLLNIYERLAIVEAQNTHLIRGQDDAIDSRKLIHQRLDGFSLIAHTVTRLEPIVADLDRIRERAIGMQIALKLFWLVAGSFSTAIGFLIHAWFYGAVKPH